MGYTRGLAVLAMFAGLLNSGGLVDAAYYPSELSVTDPLHPPTNLWETRVPRSLTPTEYWYRVQPYFPSSVTYPKEKNLTLDGEVTIEFRVDFPTDNITLNQNNITLTAENTQLSGGIGVKRVFYPSPLKQQLVIFLDRKLELGKKYNVTMKYSARINDYKTAGVFWSTYVDANKETKWVVASHFEEGAMFRSAVPSFDEPRFKTLYHVTVVHPTDLLALSNGWDLATNKLEDGWSETVFGVVKPMSCYLNAFAIGDFTNVQRYNKAGTLVRVWSWRGMEPYLDTALDAATRVLDWFGEYFEIPFMLEKEDLLGLPEFRPGAMENWGLVIFRHQQMAYNPSMGTTHHMATSVISTVVHELAHQWFGDLVTAEWWDDLFLHESFANYWETKGTFGIFPEQRNMLDVAMPTGYLETSLKFDGIRRISHPLIDPKGPYFDKITYEKGSSLFRMINHTLSEENFRLGLQRYLKAHAYSTATHDDLWNALTSVTVEKGVTDWCGNPLNLTEFMGPWTLQQGFPTIVVRTDQNGVKRISQRPYQNFTELNLPDSPYNYQWIIPDWYRLVSDDGRYRLNWLMPDDWSEEEKCVPPVIRRHDEPIIVENTASRAFARVLYDNATWTPILKYIRQNPEAFDPITRTQLLNDALVFMRTPEIPGYSRFLDLSLYLADELVFAPWKYSALNEFNQIILDHIQGPQWPLLLQYFRTTVKPVYEKLGWTHDTDWDRNSLREEITKLACRLHMGDCQSVAQELFRSQLLTACAESVPHCSKVDPDVRQAVYCAGVELGTSQDFEKTWKIYEQENDRNHEMVTERDNLLSGLACTRHTESIMLLIDYALANAAQGKVIMSSFANNPVATQILWQYLNNNTLRVLTSGDDVASYFLSAMTASWNNQVQLEALNLLASEVNSSLTESQQNVLSGAIEEVETHENNFNLLGYTITEWLLENFATPKPSALSTKIADDNLEPIGYEIQIMPYFPGSSVAKYDLARDFTFDGHVRIVIQCLRATNEIYLNADNLNISSITVTDQQSGKTIPLTERGPVYYPDIQQYVFMLQHGLQKAHVYDVEIDYIGAINTYMKDGLFHSRHTTADGDDVYTLSTQFEHIRARAVFPSFDEPQYKTPYGIILIHPADMTAISSMPVLNSEEIGNGWHNTTFEATPPTPSYLVAFALGFMSNRTAVNANGVPITVYEREGADNTIDVALYSATKSSEFFAKYLNESYPLPKLDVLGLAQYKGGGMENFGLITMASDRTTFDPAKDTTNSKARTTKIVVHEVAHQWFGDLVTMKWWDEVFLNEGFANYWEFTGPIAVYPEQAKYFRSRYVPEILSTALRGDANTSISHSLHNTDSVDPDFGSSITYSKGSALLRMLKYVLGAETFREGLGIYMNKYRFGNTVHEDLFNSLSEAAAANNVTDWCGRPLNVSELMDPWLEQQSFPIIMVESEPSRTTLTQQPYNKKATLPKSSYNYEWPVPVWYKNPQDEERLQWILPSYFGHDCEGLVTGSLELTGSAALNLEARMYAIVDYDQNSWTQLFNQFMKNPNAMDVNSRSQVLNDLQLLADHGDNFQKGRLLELISYLSSETSLAPWDTIKRWLDDLLKAVEGQPLLTFMAKRFLLSIYVPVYDTLGWEATADDWDQKILRSYILSTTCDLGYRDCETEAQTRFNAFIRSCRFAPSIDKCRSSLDPDIQEAVLCTGVRTSNDRTAFNTLLKLFQEESKVKPLTAQANRLLGALTCTTNRVQLLRIIRAVRDQPSPFAEQMLETVANKQPAAEALWSEVQKSMRSWQSSRLRPVLESLLPHWSTLSEPETNSRFDWLRSQQPFNGSKPWLTSQEALLRQRRSQRQSLQSEVFSFLTEKQFYAPDKLSRL